MHYRLTPQTNHLVVLFLILISHITLAQNIDPDFQIPNVKRMANIYDTVLQPDGKVILSGEIDFYNNQPVKVIVRLNPDGSLDNTFQPELPPDIFPVYLKVMASGDILVYESKRLIQLSPRGALKNTLLLNGIMSVVPLRDNRFFVCTNTGGLYRYRSNFKRDNSFPNIDNFANGAITDIAPQGNNFIISGTFSSVNGVAKNDLARIKANGRLDATFDTGTGTTDYIRSITIQPDGKILLRNTYINSFNGTSGIGGLARLNSNGSLDTSFMPLLNGYVKDIYFKNDKIVLSTNNKVIKLNADGTHDDTFTDIIEPVSSQPRVLVLADKSLFVAQLKTLGGLYGIAHFDKFGNNDETYQAPLSAIGMLTFMDEHEGSYIITGNFFQVNDHVTYSVAKLNANGNVDTGFKVEINNGEGYKVKVLPDGSILSSAFNAFVKLNATGEVDNSFNYSPFKKLYQINNFFVQDDQKIIAGGPNNIYRLNADGSEDVTFDIGTGICCISSTAFGLDLQADEKVLYGSYFTQFNGATANRLVRLNNDASVDNDFNIGTGANNVVYYVKQLANHDIMVAGYFNQFNGFTVPSYLVKLSPSGAVDNTFLSNFSLVAGQMFYPAMAEVNDQILLGVNRPEGGTITAILNDGTTDQLFGLPPELTFSRINNIFVSSTSDVFVLGNSQITGSGKYAMVKLNYTPSLLSGASMVEQNTTLFFPNPAKNSIQFNVKETADIKIVNFNGELLMEAQVSEANNSLDISTLQDGMYILGLESGGKQYKSYLVKKN